MDTSMSSQTPMYSTEERKIGISGSTLKLIALITMLIDHIGAAILARIIIANLFPTMQYQIFIIYNIMRYIGRIAFPIYCFLLVEGFMRTRNAGKYALRLAGFAILSEIPFDLAFSSRILEFQYQNVFFTLLWGLLAMMASDIWSRQLFKEQNTIGKKLGACVITVVCTIMAGIAAEFMHTDYGFIGVACIMVLYLFRGRKIAQIAAGAVSFLWEATAPLAFIPIGLYNGKRGMKIKYLFYLFYPLHLLILYLICMLLHIQGYPAV